MFCSKCGQQNQDGVKFCSNCGQLLETYVDPYATTVLNEPIEPLIPVAPPTPIVSYSVPIPQPKNPNKNGVPQKAILLSIIAVVLVVAIAISTVSISLFAKPSVKLSMAFKKTFIDAGGFSFNIETVEEYYDQEYDYTYENEHVTTTDGAISLGDDLISTCVYANITENSKTKYLYDGSTEKYTSASTLAFVSDGEKAIGYSKYNDEKSPAVSVNIKDAYSYILDNKEEVADFFDEDYDEIEWRLEELFKIDIDTVENWINTIVKKGKIKEDIFADVFDCVFSAWLDNWFDDVDESDVPAYKELKKALVDFIVSGVSDDSIVMEKTDSKDGVKYYEVTVNCADLLEDLVKYLDDYKKLEDFFKTSIGKAVMDILEDYVDYVKDNEDDFQFNIGLKNGYIVYIETESYKEYSNYCNRTTVTKITLSDFKGKFDFTAKYDEIAALFKKSEIVEIKTVEDIYDLDF